MDFPNVHFKMCSEKNLRCLVFLFRNILKTTVNALKAARDGTINCPGTSLIIIYKFIQVSGHFHMRCSNDLKEHLNVFHLA